MAYVSPEIQRQVQGLTTIKPVQKAVRSGGALTGALARVEGGKQVAGVARATQSTQRARGLRDTRRNISTARQDIKGANIAGAAAVGLAGASAYERVRMAEKQKQRKEEEQVGSQAIMDFINTQPERTREIMIQFGLI